MYIRQISHGSWFICYKWLFSNPYFQPILCLTKGPLHRNHSHSTSLHNAVVQAPLQITTSCQFSACNFPSYSTLSWGAGPIVPFKFKRHHYSPFKLLTHGQAAAINRRATASFKQGSLQLEQQTAPVNLFITCSNFSATSKSPLQKN